MVTKPTGRRRGRPRLPLRDDPERYWVARFLAQCELKGPGMTDRQIALAMTAVRYGEAVADSENVGNLATASGPVDFKYVKDSGLRGREDSKEPRNRSAFHPRADDLLRKARHLRSSHDQDDCKWLVAMREAWVQTLSGSPEKFALPGCLKSVFGRRGNPVLLSSIATHYPLSISWRPGPWLFGARFYSALGRVAFRIFSRHSKPTASVAKWTTSD